MMMRRIEKDADHCFPMISLHHAQLCVKLVPFLDSFLHSFLSFLYSFTHPFFPFLQQAATDPITGCIDMDSLTTGRTAAQRLAQEDLPQQLKEILSRHVMGTRREEVRVDFAVIRDEIMPFFKGGSAVGRLNCHRVGVMLLFSSFVVCFRFCFCFL